MRVPIQIKTADGRSEQTVSHDISRTGLSFTTNLDLGAGEAIDVIVGYGIARSPATQRAWVIWKRPPGAGVSAMAGVRFATAEDVEARPLEPEGALAG